MGSHPLNLFVRFLLEIAALIAVGIWGWRLGDGVAGIIAGIGVPLVLAAAWGVFAVPGDPSRSGKAPVPTPGILRLLLELAVFAFATRALFQIGWVRIGIIYGVIVLLHYLLSYDRIAWLLSKQDP